MKDEFAELYEKILNGQDWEIKDLDRLVELAKAEGRASGRLVGKPLLQECYNSMMDITGLDDKAVRDESSLCRRIREYINK